ncbi:MAG: hypothetical protein KQH67_12990 [Bacteroidetes bacterium]|nr:hypothetical protein [Bacteroidota bacterium]
MIFLIACQSDKKADIPSADSNKANMIQYDSITARLYGADPYGMKKYVMAFLKRGPNRDLDSIQASELQKAHLENIVQMAEEGNLVLAGPFFGSGEIRGIYIFNVESIEEAQILTETDPAVQAGSLEMELKEWYGSAALMAVNDIHKTLAKRGIVEE